MATLGFLSIVEHPPHGVVGGYLLVSPRGRPLEFHCSAPIWPNRAQEILYGPTLRPYLYGELIGRSLIEHAKLRPDVMLVDSSETSSLREVVDVPLALVTPQGDPTDQQQATPRGPIQLTTAPGFDADRAALDQKLAIVTADLDLLEPFERIRNAIEEAQRMTA